MDRAPADRGLNPRLLPAVPGPHDLLPARPRPPSIVCLLISGRPGRATPAGPPMVSPPRVRISAGPWPEPAAKCREDKRARQLPSLATLPPRSLLPKSLRREGGGEGDVGAVLTATPPG